jgi:hypothetical protein
LTSDPIFLLGVGAQKAGTSWLHDQLNRRKDADFGFCKEYHVFDALTLDAFTRYRPRNPPPWRWRTWRRERFFQDPTRYFDYFTGLLNRPGCRLSGDITPSYSCLGANTLQWIRHAFRERSVRTCPVFILRDPIERLLSQQRMQLRKKKQLNPADEIQAFHKLAEKLERTPSLRSDYVRTLRSLDESFAKEDICLVLFEQLFDASSHQRLYDQLRLPYQPMDVAKKVNASVSTTPVPEEILSRIGKTQATTYTTLLKEQPQLNLDRHWPTATQWCT